MGNPAPAAGRPSTARLRAVGGGLSTVGPLGAGLRPQALEERQSNPIEDLDKVENPNSL